MSSTSMTMVESHHEPEKIYLSPLVTTTTETPQAVATRPRTPNEGHTTVVHCYPEITRWNHPRSNIARVFATFWSFLILGANDAIYGAINPYLQEYYHINYTVVSLVFLSPIVGYIGSALTNNTLHVRLGQRGVSIIMSLAHLLAYLIISFHPPFPALVVVFILAGYGNGLGDSAWCAWIGDMANPNEMLGLLQAFYGLGAAIAPLIATILITKHNWEWYQFYYIMIGAALLELCFLTTTFWSWNGVHYREEQSRFGDESAEASGTSTPAGSNLETGTSANTLATDHESWLSKINFVKNSSSRTLQAVRNRVTMTASLFLLVYVGLEVSIGGWIVIFMLDVRDGTPFASGLTSTGFWVGVTVGRVVLGFITPRFKSENHAIATYLSACTGVQLIFWLVPNFVVTAVMAGWLGFFLGPLFPAAVVALTKLLPKRLHVASIGFAAAFGACGACVLPFAVGAIANAKGVFVLQPIVLAMLVVDLAIWLCIPKLPKQRTA